jgi:hypothetical protein
MRPRHGKGSKKIPIQGITAGIDWLTFYPEGAESQRAALDLWDEVHASDIANGSRCDRFHFQGMSGWRTASMAIGSSQAGSVLVSSSAVAESIATRMAPYSGRTTRLDVQVTCSLSSGVQQFATRSLSPSSETKRRGSSSQPRIGLWCQSDGSCTGMAGRRTAPRYMRVYDKGVELDVCEPGYLWRYELEAKKRLARVLWESFKETKDVRRWCYSSCEAHWRQSGLSWLLPSAGELPVAVAEQPKGPAPVEALEKWLIATVRPTVPRYVNAYGLPKLLAALGISHLVTVNSDQLEASTSGEHPPVE